VNEEKDSLIKQKKQQIQRLNAELK